MVNGVHRVVIPPGETEYPEPDAFSSPPPRTPAPLAWPAATASGPPRQLRHVLLCPEASGSPESLSACLSPSRTLEGLWDPAPVVSVTPPNPVLAHATSPTGLGSVSDRRDALIPQVICTCWSLADRLIAHASTWLTPHLLPVFIQTMPPS